MEPTLYIIMRSDIPDMNPGKAMAQAAHAQSDFDAKMLEVAKNPEVEASRKELLLDYAEWTEDRNFGRTIVVSATEDEIDRISYAGKVAGFTVDPTYPWRNYWKEVFVTDEVTCGWIFVCDTYAEDVDLVKDLPLHR